MQQRWAVIGGGIAGLAAAHRLTELQPSAEVIVLESGPRAGGVLNTTQQDGFLIEDAADGFLTTPSAAVDLCKRLGLQDHLIGMQKTCRRALVLRKGRLLPVPTGFQLMAPQRLRPLFATPILSWRGKLRAGLELAIPRKRGDDDESLQSFACRRFGQELFERLVQPLAGGIHASDPQKLSLEAAFPHFRQIEREHGSILRAMLGRRRKRAGDKSCGARYGQFASLSGGLSVLVNALTNRLQKNSLRVRSPVTSMSRLNRGRWRLSIGGSRPHSIHVDGVIIAAPARGAASLVRQFDMDFADELGGIEFASCAVVGLGYRRDKIAHPLDGFGFVVPLVEHRFILSCSFSSVKYSGRVPSGSALLRVIIGGACQGHVLKLSHDDLLELAEREVADILGIRGAPTLRRIAIHDRAMPQYHVGHRARVGRIEARMRRYPSLALAGNSFSGIGVPACIQSGESAAEGIVERLQAAYRNRATLVNSSRDMEVV